MGGSFESKKQIDPDYPLYFLCWLRDWRYEGKVCARLLFKTLKCIDALDEMGTGERICTTRLAKRAGIEYGEFREYIHIWKLLGYIEQHDIPFRHRRAIKSTEKWFSLTPKGRYARDVMVITLYENITRQLEIDKLRLEREKRELEREECELERQLEIEELIAIIDTLLTASEAIIPKVSVADIEQKNSSTGSLGYN